jgi:hypothetical protein
MPRDIICDYCYKHIGNEKLAHFSDAAKDLDFCSEVSNLKKMRKYASRFHP